MNYLEHYNRLKQTIEQLEGQQNIDLDQLVDLVDQATESYRFCENRIKQVESLIQERINRLDTNDIQENGNA